MRCQEAERTMHSTHASFWKRFFFFVAVQKVRKAPFFSADADRHLPYLAGLYFNLVSSVTLKTNNLVVTTPSGKRNRKERPHAALAGRHVKRSRRCHLRCKGRPQRHTPFVATLLSERNKRTLWRAHRGREATFDTTKPKTHLQPTTATISSLAA